MRLLLLFLILNLSNFVYATGYPSKPIRFLVGAAPGGGEDTSARILSEYLSINLNTNVVVDNRPAAAGVIARQILKTSGQDGYTISVLSSSQVINAALINNDPISKSDILIFASVSTQPYWLVVNAKTNYVTLSDLIKFATVNPNAITYGSFGVGSAAHLAGALLAKRTKVNFLHVPYRGSAASVQDLLSHNISFVFSSGSAIIPHVQTGRLRALAVSSMKRNKIMPNIPTVVELGVKDFDVTGWYSLAIHQKTNEKIINFLSKTVAKTMQIPKVQERFANIGSEVWINDIATMQKIVKEEEQRYLGLVDLKSLQ